MMQAMPDEVVAHSNGIMRFEGPGRYASRVDLEAEPMKSLIATMARRQITADPTLVVAESLFVPENGDLSPAYAPFVGTLPPATERAFRQGGFAVPKDLTRADYRKSFRKLSDLVAALHKAGVPIVAGTDGSGLELVRELELYVDAGFTPAEALAAATLAPARLLGVDARTGSIAVGKAADLVLVLGRSLAENRRPPPHPHRDDGRQPDGRRRPPRRRWLHGRPEARRVVGPRPRGSRCSRSRPASCRGCRRRPRSWCEPRARGRSVRGRRRSFPCSP